MNRFSIGLLAAVVLFNSTTSSGAQHAPSVQVDTVPLRRQPLANTLTAYGTVTASEESMAIISLPHGGQVVALEVRSGQKVHAGDRLVTVNADPTALQSYQKAVTALDFAQRELSRQKTLLTQHLATNSQVAAAEQTVKDAKITLETERKLGNDQPSSAATAPFDGYIAQLMAAPGDRLQANTAIMKLARTDRGLHVSAGLKVEDASHVSSGMQAELTPILSPGAQPLEGVVREISGNLSPATRLVEVWIDLPQSKILVPGSMVKVDIILSRQEGWVVPRDAVLHDDAGSHIFQVSDGRAKRIAVKTGLETSEVTEISGPLDSSLPVVTRGNYELVDGMAVHSASSTTK